MGLIPCLACAQTADTLSHRLPPEAIPELGCWFWSETDFEPEGYREFVDLVATHSSYGYLTASLRVPRRELLDAEVHQQLKAAAVYARERGIEVVMDLDVRLARRAFQARYPDELQQMLLLHEMSLSGEGAQTAEIRSRELHDHYTGNTTPYIALRGEVVRVVSYIMTPTGIDPHSLCDITSACEVLSASPEAVKVSIPSEQNQAGRTACVMVLFTHLAADVFAPHLLAFQRELLRQYADAPFAGACKDEWGFPPCFDGNPAKDQFWYSLAMAVAYAQCSGGRDLLADCLLMSKAFQGMEETRQAVINYYTHLVWKRNVECETDFYEAVKEVFGPQTLVATHPTWWPYPDAREMMKNGLDWWAAKRDWAQTDETTPFAARTALTKKWGSPVWHNMYYSSEKPNYETSIWQHALAGGRINYHPLYPRDISRIESVKELLRGELARAQSRVRLLNFIQKTPLDCPVAVIFGHASAMNWAGPGYNDVGMAVADALWQAGYPADLIPSSEVETGQLTIDAEGWIRYGTQPYAAVVLYQPQFSQPVVASFFQKASQGRTALYRWGDWTQDFAAKAFDGKDALPDSMRTAKTLPALLEAVIQSLQDQCIPPQTPATAKLQGFATTSAAPPTTGFCRLLDGTVIYAAGTEQVAGDPIHASFSVRGRPVKIQAEGLAAVRLDAEGQLDALAAGSLKSVQLEGFSLTLPVPLDLALWKDSQGKYHGVIQHDNREILKEREIPKELIELTEDWIHLPIPTPCP